MQLKVLLPSQVLVDEPVRRIAAEGQNGYFTLLPRHIDYTAALVPGILSYRSRDGAHHYLATDEGTLVKKGDQVLVSVRQAVPGDDLARLNQLVEAEFLKEDEQEKKMRSASARIEAGFVRRFLEISKNG